MEPPWGRIIGRTGRWEAKEIGGLQAGRETVLPSPWRPPPQVQPLEGCLIGSGPWQQVFPLLCQATSGVGEAGKGLGTMLSNGAAISPPRKSPPSPPAALLKRLEVDNGFSAIENAMGSVPTF